MKDTYRRKSNKALLIGLLGQGMGLFMTVAGWGLPGSLLAVTGTSFFVYGCASYALGKGYTGWFGLLGLLSFPGLVVLLVLPDSKTEVTRPKRKVSVLAILTVFLGVCCLLAFANKYILKPLLSENARKAQAITCRNQLKMVSVDLRMYAMDHHDAYPTNFVQLKAMAHPSLFICPASPHASKRSALKWQDWSDELASYEINADSLRDMDNRPTNSILRCKYHNNVLLGDGSVMALRQADAASMDGK